MSERHPATTLERMEALWLALQIRNPAFTVDDNAKFDAFRRAVATEIDVERRDRDRAIEERAHMTVPLSTENVRLAARVRELEDAASEVVREMAYLFALDGGDTKCEDSAAYHRLAALISPDSSPDRVREGGR